MEEQHETEMKSNVPGVLELNSEELAEEQQSARQKITSNVKGMLEAISKMIGSEQINPHQAQQLRAQLGIFQSYFTRKQPDKKKRKIRNKIAKKSRRMNRLRGRKGLVNRKGQRYTK